MAQLNFDATQVAPNEAIEPIPAGWYNAMIDESEMKPAKTEGNYFLQLRFTIIEGMYANRKVYTRLNLRNSNPQAQEIAYKELSAICHAVGVMQVQDSQQLHGRPLKIKVKLKPAADGYDASNEVNGFKNTGEQVQQVAAPWTPQAPPQQPQQPQQFAPAAQPVQQFAPPPVAQQAPQQQAPAWQPPAAAQPWNTPAAMPPAAQPVAQQPAPQALPPQQPQQAPQQAAPVPPWVQQVAEGNNGAPPPWAAPQQ
jgi:hypothetical protein